ncbi:hypothetical protein [Ornithinibacillus halophilus]|uniref:Diamine N-acetyltransferase n=1 Tax=Ornithinibacillus halophilus TaxID=930117 RepID=A0A1M5L8L2_9BACI|nr:hypothetical protein [Ornithinibacillus halophilus]SHG61432.1 diamine N-acetyltransferase [Ornithinibacillus halophilus]
MHIEFKEVDKSNYEECVELEIHEEQKDFISPNWELLLEVKYEEGERYPSAIYKDSFGKD